MQRPQTPRDETSSSKENSLKVLTVEAQNLENQFPQLKQVAADCRFQANDLINKAEALESAVSGIRSGRATEQDLALVASLTMLSAGSLTTAAMVHVSKAKDDDDAVPNHDLSPMSISEPSPMLVVNRPMEESRMDPAAPMGTAHLSGRFSNPSLEQKPEVNLGMVDQSLQRNPHNDETIEDRKR